MCQLSIKYQKYGVHKNLTDAQMNIWLDGWTDEQTDGQTTATAGWNKLQKLEVFGKRQ